MQQPSLIKHLRDILLLPFTVTVIIPWLIYDPRQHFFPGNVLANVAIKVAGMSVLAPALILFLRTVLLFRKKGNGTIAPWTPTQKLIVAGPYKYCRNPMITGVFFILISEALFFHSLNILILAAIFFVVNTIYFILKEEPDLYNRFGEEYADYKAKVPRWIPKSKPYRQRRLKENN